MTTECFRAAEQLRGPLGLRVELLARGRNQACRRSSLTWQLDLRGLSVLENQPAGRGHGSQLRVAELFQQAEHVAVNRLLPDVVAVAKVTADPDGSDAGVQGARIQGQHPAFAVAKHTDLQCLLAG